MRKRLSPEITERLEASRAIYKAMRKWYHGQIVALDRSWMIEAGDLIDSSPAMQIRNLEGLERRLAALSKMSPADALVETEAVKDSGS